MPDKNWFVAQGCHVIAHLLIANIHVFMCALLLSLLTV